VGRERLPENSDRPIIMWRPAGVATMEAGISAEATDGDTASTESGLDGCCL
jgi:hypothetical protein